MDSSLNVFVFTFLCSDKTTSDAKRANCYTVQQYCSSEIDGQILSGTDPLKFVQTMKIVSEWLGPSRCPPISDAGLFFGLIQNTKHNLIQNTI